MKQNTIINTNFGQTAGRWLLGVMLMTAGTSHLTWAKIPFRAQVPDWIPLNTDLVVLLSGIVEILLGASIAFWSSKKVFCGWVAALFFILVFPGNISQYVNHRNAFGLNTDGARAARLFFQPVLIAWAIWSTGAWAAWRSKNNSIN